jgi:hypothetical protein
LSFILKLRPVSYYFNYKKFDDFLSRNKQDNTANPVYQQQLAEQSSHREIGFVAQEVEKLCADSNFVFNGLYKP